MPETLHVTPIWDEAAGRFKVVEATQQGLSGVSGGDAETFESCLAATQPPGTIIEISYPDKVVTLEP